MQRKSLRFRHRSGERIGEFLRPTDGSDVGVVVDRRSRRSSAEALQQRRRRGFQVRSRSDAGAAETTSERRRLQATRRRPQRCQVHVKVLNPARVSARQLTVEASVDADVAATFHSELPPKEAIRRRRQPAKSRIGQSRVRRGDAEQVGNSEVQRIFRRDAEIDRVDPSVVTVRSKVLWSRLQSRKLLRRSRGKRRDVAILR